MISALIFILAPAALFFFLVRAIVLMLVKPLGYDLSGPDLFHRPNRERISTVFCLFVIWIIFWSSQRTWASFRR